ncbi:Transmembrane protein [Quillaja saponaria]|uniref:Transmembrane protein n=1 Tax=Quillaja saponaria TaxID=32244 RepID=A0AAD7L142_QUISA|nr:Transmembrane protein [Quillaja saponaria]
MQKSTHPCEKPSVSNPKENDAVSIPIPISSLPPHRHESQHHHTATITTPPIRATAPIMLTAFAATSSWFRSRPIRYLFLFLCSPLLLPLLCAAFPIIYAAELCFRRMGKLGRESQEDERLRRCEEGCGCGGGGDEEDVGLLQRYLEDQLLLVGSVYECGDEDDDGGEFVDSCRTPLLS